jgi:hypothetical protein
LYMINRANVHHTHRQGRIDFPSVGKEIRMLSEQSRADSKTSKRRMEKKKERTDKKEPNRLVARVLRILLSEEEKGEEKDEKHRR